MTNRPPTIGLLYPGEMGAAMARLLAARGVAVITTVAGRGPRTVGRCREAGVEVLETLEDVVRRSNVVLSVVSPAAAEMVANDYARLSRLAPAGALFVDANSIGPDLAERLAERLQAAGIDFVDAAVNGLAKNLATTGTTYLSGGRAAEVAELFAEAARVRVLSDRPGRASAMKMLLSGLSKGVCALFIETALLARQQEMLSEMTEAYEQIYPSVMALVERMLPTYAEHANRRAAEMAELEQTARAAGLVPLVLTAVRELHARLAEVNFDKGSGGSSGGTATSLLERLAAERFLSATVAATAAPAEPSSTGPVPAGAQRRAI